MYLTSLPTRTNDEWGAVVVVGKVFLCSFGSPSPQINDLEYHANAENESSRNSDSQLEGIGSMAEESLAIFVLAKRGVSCGPDAEAKVDEFEDQGGDDL